MPTTEGSIRITSVCPIPGGDLVLATFSIETSDVERYATVHCDFGRFRQRAFVSCVIPNDTSTSPEFAYSNYHYDQMTLHTYFPVGMKQQTLLTLIGTFTG